MATSNDSYSYNGQCRSRILRDDNEELAAAAEPSLRLEDVGYVVDGVGQFVVGGVEVGGDAQAGTGAEIDQDVTAGKFG